MYIYLTPIVTYVQFKLVLIILHLSVNQRIPSAATHRCYKCVFSRVHVAHSRAAEVLVFRLKSDSSPCC